MLAQIVLIGLEILFVWLVFGFCILFTWKENTEPNRFSVIATWPAVHLVLLIATIIGIEI